MLLSPLGDKSKQLDPFLVVKLLFEAEYETMQNKAVYSRSTEIRLQNE